MNYEIIVIGESCYDTFILGNVNRLSPEAPIPIVNPIETIQNFGMSGNVYANISALKPNVSIDHIYQKDFKMMNKIRYVDKVSGYILLRVDENDKVKERIDVDETTKHIESQIPFLKAVVISDYNKGFLSEEDIEKISSFCFEKSVPVFLDTKKILGHWSSNITFVKINQKEYENQIEHLDNPIKYCKNLIVTKGSLGSCWINENILIPTEESEVRDVAGAGDTYLSAFVVKYITSNDVKESMKYANKAATFAVSKQGVVIVNKQDLE